MGHVPHQQKIAVRVGHVHIIDGLTAAVADGGDGVDDLHPVHQEGQLLEARLIVGKQTGPEAVCVLLQLHPGVLMSRGDALSLGGEKAELHPPVRQDFRGLGLVHMGKGIGGVVGDELPVEAQSPGIEGLVLQKMVRNMHKLLLLRRCSPKLYLYPV